MKPVILVDLDGVLAHYDEWRGEHHIGHPIRSMIQRVKQWHRNGREVCCWTARASTPLGTHYVEQWLSEHGLSWMTVTNKKGYDAVELWDDRAVCVERNTGRVLGRPRQRAKPCASLKP